MPLFMDRDEKARRDREKDQQRWEEQSRKEAQARESQDRENARRYAAASAEEARIKQANHNASRRIFDNTPAMQKAVTDATGISGYVKFHVNEGTNHEGLQVIVSVGSDYERLTKKEIEGVRKMVSDVTGLKNIDVMQHENEYIPRSPFPDKSEPSR